MTQVYSDKPLFLLYKSDGGRDCQHERIYATREMAEMNLDQMLREEYRKYLKRYVSRLPSTGDPSPMDFFRYAETTHGWAIEEVEAIA